MTYQSRIPADPEYIKAVGTAFYNFTYLEWVVIWSIVKLSATGFASVPTGKTASFIAKAFHKAINTTSPVLSPSLRKQLTRFHKSYLAAIQLRNKLLHAHPCTAPGGMQQLAGGGVQWPIETVYAAALQFENAAIQGSSVFHGSLMRERPNSILGA